MKSSTRWWKSGSAIPTPLTDLCWTVIRAPSPRPQHLDQWLESRGMHEVVIHLAVDYNVIIARLTGRRQCPRCGTLYNMASQPPREDSLCDTDGEALVVREDDQRSGDPRTAGSLRAADPAGAGVLRFGRTVGWWRWMPGTNLAGSGVPRRFARHWRRMIVRKTAAELEKMRRSGLLVWQILQKLKELSVEGATTWDLEVAAEKMMADAGAQGPPSKATTCRRPARLTSLCCVPR